MKSLEKEYKEAIKNETPDLWSRIEAGVDAYEASKKETAPETVEAPLQVTPDNVVSFRFKKVINIIGKISVAAVLIAVVAVTYKVTRTGRKDYSAHPAAEATMADSAAEEATHDYSPSEEASKPIDLMPSPAEAETSESPIMNDASKEESPSLNIDSPSKRGEEAADYDANPSFETGEDAVTVKSLVRTFDIGNIEAVRLLSELNNLGLTDLRGLTVMENEETDSSVYGFETDAESFSIASFTAGTDNERYLLFYSAEKASGIKLLAVKKDDETGTFIYSEK